MKKLKIVYWIILINLNLKKEQKTICSKVGMKLNIPVEDIKPIMDYLAYENIITYVKVKRNNITYVTPKIVKPARDIIS